MDFLKTMFLATSGIRAQNGRMRVIAENIANAQSTGRTAEEEPYRRKIPTFLAKHDSKMQVETVQIGRIIADKSDFKTRYEPGHPAADAEGFIRLPNVDSLIETADMREAQRSYEANINIIKSARQMMQRTIDILRR